MVILITGASGFVGWNAVRHFAGRGHDIVATFHTFSHYLHQVDGCQPVPLDFADRVAIEQVVARFQPDLILHAAALSRPQQSGNESALRAINTDASGHLAKAAAEHGSGLVYISTDLVYPSLSGPCDESTPVAPSGAGGYSASKLAGEALVREAGGRWIVLRSTLMFGEGTPRSNSFTQFIDRNWSAGRAAPLFSDQFRSFLYVGDLIRAIEHVAITKPSWNELFTCGGPERISRAGFGLRYADACGVDRAMCDIMRASDLEGYVGGASDIWFECAKLRATGWAPRSIEECFVEMMSTRLTE
jgi:dTDP-4-dehydrorhamnose reductase